MVFAKASHGIVFLLCSLVKNNCAPVCSSSPAFDHDSVTLATYDSVRQDNVQPFLTLDFREGQSNIEVCYRTCRNRLGASIRFRKGKVSTLCFQTSVDLSTIPSRDASSIPM